MASFFSDTHLAHPEPEQTPQILYQGQVQSVSFSTLSTFEKCPYAIYLSKVTGIPGMSGPAADRGSKLHEMLEDYVQGTRPDVNWSTMKSNDHYAPIIESFKEGYATGMVMPELKLAFTKDMIVTDWDKPDAWLRGAIDVTEYLNVKKTKAILYDYKSGQDSMAAKHRSQLMLYALMMFIAYPELEEIKCAAIYLDIKKELFFTDFTRNDLDILWSRYQWRLQQVTECQNFKPNPNGFTCKWCQHKKIQPELGQTAPACEYAHRGR
tara:strand:- start:25529 stop:26326 length:798 start_codon:yes stop_codon:yes gene_type:complete